MNISSERPVIRYLSKQSFKKRRKLLGVTRSLRYYIPALADTLSCCSDYPPETFDMESHLLASQWKITHRRLLIEDVGFQLVFAVAFNSVVYLF